MRLNFVKMNPAGNITIFVFDPVPRKFHGRIARLLMKPEYLCADQVGFVEKPDSEKATARLQMMGGEFCGNAIRAMAALIAEREYAGIRYLNSAQTGFHAIVPLEASGCTGLVETEIKKFNGCTDFWAEAPIPAPLALRCTTMSILGSTYATILVEFPGITHVVLTDLDPSEAVFGEIVQQVGPVEALGVMFYQANKQFMTPLVSVIETGSLVWEGSCGSGTVALAAAQAVQTGNRVDGLVVTQPGGSITVDIEYSSAGPGRGRIKGPVEFVAEGSVRIPLPYF